LVEIKAREKFNHRHMGDIPRIQFFAQHRYLSASGGSGKLAIYGWALVTIVVNDILSINETEAKGAMGFQREGRPAFPGASSDERVS
jgi:hypothetical protein